MDNRNISVDVTLDKSDPCNIHFSNTKSLYAHGDALEGHTKHFGLPPSPLNKLCGCTLSQNCAVNLPCDLDKLQKLLPE